MKKLLSRPSSLQRQGKYVGICGQGPSDHPDLAEWLMEQGIDSMSLNPDTVVETWFYAGRTGQDSLENRKSPTGGFFMRYRKNDLSRD